MCGQPRERFARQVVHRRTACRPGLPAVAVAGNVVLNRSQSPGDGFGIHPQPGGLTSSSVMWSHQPGLCAYCAGEIRIVSSGWERHSCLTNVLT